LRGRFYMTSGSEFPLRVASGYNELKIDAVLLSLIREQISLKQVDVVQLDPLITLHGVNEQDNGRMDTVIRLFASIADEHDCAIGLSHHTRKQTAASVGSDYGVDDMRGASSIRDAVRAARVLNQMAAKEAQDIGVPDHERLLYFRVDRAKGNNAPPTKAVWRKFVNVELKNGHDVGVVEPWLFPGQDGPAADLEQARTQAETVFLQLLHRFTLQGRDVSHHAGKNYAPPMFAQEQEAKDARLGRKQLEEAMRRLLSSGRIRSETEGTGGRKKTRLVAI
jgi:RecA-family ATPase